MVLGRELGPEFDQGRQDPGLITLKLGRNLYQGADGTIHAMLRDRGLTWIDWGWIAFACGWTLIIGYLIGIGGLGRLDQRTAWAVWLFLAAMAVGWVARMIWAQRRRHGRFHRRRA